MNIVTLAIALSIAIQSGRLPGTDIPEKLLTAVPEKSASVLKVNGQSITANEVMSLLWDWKRDEVISELIDDRIVRQEANKNGIAATDEEVNTALKDLLNSIQASLPPGKTIEQAMVEQGVTQSRLWLRVRTEVLLRKIVMKEFKASDYVKVSTIIVRPASESSEELRKALDKAEDYYKRLQNKESWDEVLKSSTTDARIIQGGGYVGWRATAAFPQAVQEEFKTAKVGFITKPVQTASGIQIFKVDAIGTSLKGEELTELEGAFYNGKRAATLDNLRAAAKIERN